MKLPEVILVPLQPDDREQFILDNQWAFKYGAQQEFGMRDERCEEGEEVISRKTIENSIDGENAETYRIVLDGQKVGEHKVRLRDPQLLLFLTRFHGYMVLLTIDANVTPFVASSWFSFRSILFSVSKNSQVATDGPIRRTPKVFQPNICHQDVCGPSIPNSMAFAFSSSAILAIQTSV